MDTEIRAAARTLSELLSSDDWDSLREHMQLAPYEAGSQIVAQGALSPSFHVIAEGIASVVAKGPHGEPRELGRLGAGECIGEMSLLTGEPASADVIALTPVKTYTATQSQLAGLGELRLRVIEALSMILATRLKHANERLLTLTAANLHVISCPRGLLPAIAGLPAAVARATQGRVLALISTLEGDGASLIQSGEGVTVRRITADDYADLPRILHNAAHEFEEMLMVSSDPTPPAAGAEPTTSVHVVSERELATDVSSRATRLVVVSNEAWTQPTVRRFSDAAGRQVVAVLRVDAGDPDGRDPVGRLARTLTGRTVGLALGAGAAKGLAHLGVLRALNEMHVPIDAISGCSIGAPIAAGRAANMDLQELTELVTQTAARAIRPTLPIRSFLSNAGVREELKRLAEDRRIEDLDLPLAIVTTDLYRRSEVTFTTGLIWPRLLASMAIPGVYPPTPAMGSFLVDGGVVSPVPVGQCRDLGAGIVIGVRLTATRTSPRERLDVSPKMPLTIETIMRTFEIMLNRISELSRENADVNIEICVDGDGGVGDFKRGDTIARIGYEATINAAASIQTAIPYIKAPA